MNLQKEPHLAALSQDIGAEPPTEFLLFKGGLNETSKGTYLLDDTAIASIMDAYARAGVDVMIDYNHLSVGDYPTSDAHKAAGWAQLEARAGDLWAVHVRWTPAAAAAIRGKEWRYTSPTFAYDPENGRILRMINVAITNMPATLGAVPLVAASQSSSLGEIEQETSQNKEETMEKEEKDDKLREACVALTGAAETAAITAQLSAWRAEAKEAAAAREELAALKAQIEGERHAARLSQAVEAGKIAPSEVAYWQTQSLANLEGYLNVAATRLSKAIEVDAPKGGNAAVLGKLGLTAEEYTDAQARFARLGWMKEGS